MNAKMHRGFCAALLGSLALLVGCGGSGGSNSSNGPQVFTQIDRAGRPEVNMIFATVKNGETQAYVSSVPSSDATDLGPEIVAFMTHAAGRTAGIANQAATILTPDVIIADLGQTGPANYLGIELTTAAQFGGRKLTDDVVSTDLGIAFGNSLGTDGKETPALSTDNVNATTAPKHFQDGEAGFGAAAFPYLGVPQ